VVLLLATDSAISIGAAISPSTATSPFAAAIASDAPATSTAPVTAAPTTPTAPIAATPVIPAAPIATAAPIRPTTPATAVPIIPAATASTASIRPAAPIATVAPIIPTAPIAATPIITAAGATTALIIPAAPATAARARPVAPTAASSMTRSFSREAYEADEATELDAFNSALYIDYIEGDSDDEARGDIEGCSCDFCSNLSSRAASTTATSFSREADEAGETTELDAQVLTISALRAPAPLKSAFRPWRMEDYFV
ncbi:hypothetical protein FB645_004189, partial [Coemansia sp. IMI 203386]